MRKIYFGILIAISIFLLVKNGSTKELILGVHPYLSFYELEQRFTPLVNFLSNELGEKVTLKIGSSFNEHIKTIGKNKIDIAYISPAAYVMVCERYGIKPIICTLVNNYEPYFTGKIISKESLKIKDICEIENYKIAFVSPKSTMGYILPMYMFLKNNCNIKKIISNQTFLKSHENVAIGVLSGDYDVGAVKDEIFYKYKSEGLKALFTTIKVPDHLFIVRSNMDKKMIVKIRNSFYKLNLSKKGKVILKNIKPTLTGIIYSDYSNYRFLSNILNDLEKHGIKIDK